MAELKPCPECEQAARELGRYKKKVADDAKRIEELEAQVAAFRETGKLYEWFVAATLRMFGADCREKAVELPMEQVMDLDREARLRMMVDPEEKVYIMWGEEKQ